MMYSRYSCCIDCELVLYNVLLLLLRVLRVHMPFPTREMDSYIALLTAIAGLPTWVT